MSNLDAAPALFVDIAGKPMICGLGKSQRLRFMVFDGYGGKCACCGNANWTHLAIDHVNNDGSQERKVMTQMQIMQKIISKKFPPEYQLLCHNCNTTKKWGVPCLHDGSAEELRIAHMMSLSTRLHERSDRYHSDPEYRQRKINAAVAWNLAHPGRKSENDKRWAAVNGATAAKRYRNRKKAKK